MKKTWKGLLLLGTTMVAAGLTSPAESADHRDSAKTTADATSDINDVFSFVDGSNFILGMTVTPFAATGAKFGTAVQHVWHTTSGTKFGETKATQDVVCTFDAAQKIQCWVGKDDYVTGDASDSTKPLKSTSGKVQVYAGMRSDPFYFNLQGFKDTVTAVEAAASGLTFDTSGCPALNASTSAALVGLLKEKTSTAAATKATEDDFGAANTLAIVLSVDKSLVTKGGAFVSVWASTNKAP